MKNLVVPVCLLALLSGCESVGTWLMATPGQADNRAEASVPAAAAVTGSTAAPAASSVAAPAPLAAPRSATQPPQVSGIVRDPGVRTTQSAAGAPQAGLDRDQLAAFNEGRAAFMKEYSVKAGLGPAMDLDHCAGCHYQPAVGGSSGSVNPQVSFASKLGATNTLPPFISRSGPARVARFVRKPDGSLDGAVRNLFTISGRSDAPGACKIAQPDFHKEFAANNIVTRIGLPVFGDGLIEQIPNPAIAENLTRNAQRKAEMGIRGKVNNFGRFGWKSQLSSLSLFAASAYNNTMGLSSDLFPQEATDIAECRVAGTPNLVPDPKGRQRGDLEKVMAFLRFLAPPAPSTDTPGGSASIISGKALFSTVGCDLCHVPQMRTGQATVAALRDKPVELYSDLLIHNMGSGLMDYVSQGAAGWQDWRTTPLWGLGQRIYLLHDGRTTDVREAILAHRSPGSEANAVIDKYSELPPAQEQDLLNFLRSL
jgi:CxxC motif-containing protein (DUF1111 family)